MARQAQCHRVRSALTQKVNVSEGKKSSISCRFTKDIKRSTAVFRFNAEEGPLGTSNYRLELQAASLPDGKTFMHLRDAYEYGIVSRVAMQTYLATLGLGNVGFTPIWLWLNARDPR